MNNWFKELRSTLFLAVPIMIGQIGHMLMGISDTILVGGVNVESLAAAAFTNGIINVCLVFGIGLLSGVSILVSQAYGAQDRKEAGEVLRHGLLLSIVSSFLIGVALWLFSGFALNHFGQELEVVRLSKPFLTIVGWSLVPALTWQCLRQYCEAQSHSVVPMLVMLGGVALNTLLGWILIYGHYGFTPMGLYGAGIATFVARVVMLVALILIMVCSNYLDSNLLIRCFKAISWKRILNLLNIGIPVSLQLLLEVGAFAIAAVFMGQIGAHYLAAHQIAITCAATTFMLPYGLSVAVSVRIAQAIGANEFYRVRRIGYSGFVFTIVMMLTISAAYILFGGKLARLFINDQSVVALAVQMYFVAAFFQVFDGVQVIGMGALRGLSDVKPALFIAFFSYWVIAIPISLLLKYILKDNPVNAALGIWWGLAAGLSFASIALLIRFYLKTKSFSKSQPTSANALLTS